MQTCIWELFLTGDAHGAKSGRKRSGALSRRVIAGIREDPVDLLFISGDLFHRQPLMRELKEVNYLFSTIPDTRVYLMAGNHDFISLILFIVLLSGIPM